MQAESLASCIMCTRDRTMEDFSLWRFDQLGVFEEKHQMQATLGIMVVVLTIRWVCVRKSHDSFT